MNIGIVSSRYAKALYRFAESNGTTEEVYAEMQQMASSFLHVKELANILQNPTLPKETKKAILVAAANTGNEVCTTTRKFISLCIAQKREELLHFIAQSYIHQYEVANNITGSSLTVARPVSEDIVKKFQKFVESRTENKVEMKVVVNPAIKGGFILQYDDNRLDASLNGQIQRIRRKLVGETVS